ncbi:hypothetical protein JTB14_017721 [Gonioctena quinquepunctata]|nr:hypothetical protein JTB14_017721 [Gonioctena quinquepunctata]
MCAFTIQCYFSLICSKWPAINSIPDFETPLRHSNMPVTPADRLEQGSNSRINAFDNIFCHRSASFYRCTSVSTKIGETTSTSHRFLPHRIAYATSFAYNSLSGLRDLLESEIISFIGLETDSLSKENDKR